MLEVKKAEKKEKEDKSLQKEILNKVPALRDNPDRQGFVVKVYLICSVMIGITASLCGYVLSDKEMQQFMRTNFWLHYVAIFTGVGIMCSIMCCQNMAKKVPVNYILLFAFTFVWSYMVAGFVQWFDPAIVLAAAALTFAMFVGLTLFTVCCNFNLTICWGLGAACSVVVWPMFFMMFIWPSKLLYLFLCGIIVILTSIYIIIDTKIIMEKLDTDEYIIGALLLYVDLIQLFMHILALLGNSN